MRRKKEENYLDNIPVRNTGNTWQEENGIVTVHVVNNGVYNKIAQKLFKTPQISHIALDEYGSFVWGLVDGKRTIYDIGELVKKEFGKNAEPLYPRLTKYFYTLRDTHFVTFREKEK